MLRPGGSVLAAGVEAKSCVLDVIFSPIDRICEHVALTKISLRLMTLRRCESDGITYVLQPVTVTFQVSMIQY